MCADIDPYVRKKGALDSLPKWLRWILVTPAAITSYFGIQIVVAFIHGIAEELDVLSPLVSFMGDYLPQLVNSIIGAYAFVWVGVWMAPSHRFPTSVVLAAVLSLLTCSSVVFLLVQPQLQESLVWLLFTSLLGIGAAVKACVDWRERISADRTTTAQ